MTPAAVEETPAEQKAPEKSAAPAPSPAQAAEQKPAPSVFMPSRPPDDPGVAQTEAEESPVSLERLRAAQIR